MNGGNDRLDGGAGTDKVWVSAADFGPGLAPASLLGHFAQSTSGTATGTGVRFTYDTAGPGAGELWWDVEGGGAAAGVLVATFTGTPSLVISDFLVVA